MLEHENEGEGFVARNLGQLITLIINIVFHSRHWLSINMMNDIVDFHIYNTERDPQARVVLGGGGGVFFRAILRDVYRPPFMTI